MNVASEKLSKYGTLGASKRWGNTTVHERFWRHVDKRGPDECWNWNPKTKTRYPIFKITKEKGTSANRASWMLTHGDIPQGIHVLHKCDNTQCCNPSHLFLGTHTDNMRDCANKKRLNTHHGPQKNPNHSFAWLGIKGDRHPSTIYPDSLVEKLRQLHKPYKVTANQLSKDFRIPFHVVRSLLYHRGNHPTKYNHAPT